MTDMWSRRVSQARAALTASGRVLSLVPALFRPRTRDRETAVPWEDERLFFDGDRWFEQILSDIAQARKWITVEMYLVAADEIGERFMVGLAQAAERGVAVRLMVDGLGSATWLRSRSRNLLEQGIEIGVYHPTPWSILPFAWAHRWELSRLSNPLRWINRRNHRKVVVIDRRVAFVGSFNIDRRHLRSLSGDQAWRDTGARVEGAGVRTLERAFARAWRQSWQLTPHSALPRFQIGSHRPRIPVAHLVRLNHGVRVRRRWRRELLSRIGSANRRVWITSAYFVPDRLLLYALSLAAASKADVRVLVPMRSDHWFMTHLTRAFYHQLVKSGVHVHEYQPSMIHAKTVIVDDWACVGSTNLNHRSLLHDLEADVVLTRPQTRDELADAFRQDLTRSSEVTSDHWRSCGKLQRWLGRCTLTLKHWM